MSGPRKFLPVSEQGPRAGGDEVEAPTPCVAKKRSCFLARPTALRHASSRRAIRRYHSVAEYAADVNPGSQGMNREMFRCARFQKGDPAACQLALEKARQGVRRILGLSREQQVQDVAQDAVRELWERRATLRAEDDLGAVAYVRGRSRAINYLRDCRREQDLMARLERETALEHKDNPDPEVLTQREQDCLERFVDSEGGQLALENAHGKSMRDIALERGIALERVHAKITKARNDLRTCLGLHADDRG